MSGVCMCVCVYVNMYFNYLGAVLIELPELTGTDDYFRYNSKLKKKIDCVRKSIYFDPMHSTEQSPVRKL